MKINDLLKFFVPKDESFFPLFDGTAKCILEAAKLLNDLMFENSDQQRSEIISQIKKLEHEGDNYTHKVYEQLNKSFLAPFDREDIHILASHLDDVLDFIYDISQRIEWYKLKTKEFSDEFKFFVTIINEMAEEIKNCVASLRDASKNKEEILQSCYRLNTLENKADVIFYSYMNNLLDIKENDTKNLSASEVPNFIVEIIKNKDMFQTLEKCADSAEDVSDIIKTILIKNV